MRKGITLPELLISLGILAILFGITTITLLSSQRTSAQKATRDAMLADIRDQQTKAMAQDTQGTEAPSDYGVYLAQDAYTLFRGSTYNQSDTSNFSVELDPSLQLANITFSSSVIVFEAGSGAIANFDAVNSTFAILDLTNGQSSTVAFNGYGIPFD